MSKNKFFKTAKYVARKISANRMGVYSAQTAFFTFFSLIPLLMLLIMLITQFGASSEEMIEKVSDYAPGVLINFIESYYDDILAANRLSLTIVSIITLLWSASKGVYSIVGGLNSVYEIKESRNPIAVRLLSVLYTVAFIGIVVAALLLMVFGNAIGEYLYSNFSDIKPIVYIISSLRFIIGFVLLVLFFVIIYKALPGTKLRFIDQIPGAVLSGAGWVSFSIIFSFYIDNFSNYSNIYGSLTAIIALMLWLYVCMYIMFFGAQVNYILSSKARKADRTN